MRDKRSITISKAWHVRVFLQHLENAGVNWQKTAKQIGLPTRMPDPGSFLPTDMSVQLIGDLVARQDYFEMAVRASLGSDGRLQIWESSPHLTRASLAAPSLYSCLQTLCALVPTQWTGLQYWLRETEDAVWLCSRNQSPRGSWGTEQVVQARICQLVAIIEKYLGHAWRPEVINLETLRLPSTLLEGIMGGAVVNAGCECSSIKIPKMLTARSGPVLRQWRSAPAQQEDDSDASRWDWLTRLQALLPEYILCQNATVETAADLLCINARTLQRALRDEGLTFRCLLNNVRLELARKALADPVLKIEEVGRILGYSEPTNFTRAFRRASGCSPQEYRARLDRFSHPPRGMSPA